MEKRFWIMVDYEGSEGLKYNDSADTLAEALKKQQSAVKQCCGKECYILKKMDIHIAVVDPENLS